MKLVERYELYPTITPEYLEYGYDVVDVFKDYGLEQRVADVYNLCSIFEVFKCAVSFNMMAASDDGRLVNYGNPNDLMFDGENGKEDLKWMLTEMSLHYDGELSDLNFVFSIIEDVTVRYDCAQRIGKTISDYIASGRHRTDSDFMFFASSNPSHDEELVKLGKMLVSFADEFVSDTRMCNSHQYDMQHIIHELADNKKQARDAGIPMFSQYEGDALTFLWLSYRNHTYSSMARALVERRWTEGTGYYYGHQYRADECVDYRVL